MSLPQPIGSTSHGSGPITYPEHFEIRRVSTNGGIRWNKRWVNVSHILAELLVGLEPLTSGTWNLFFGPIHLGWLDERDYRVHDRRDARSANATCYPSGDNTCYSSAETFTATDTPLWRLGSPGGRHCHG